MKLTNLLQLTEHHRYVVVRRFGLSPLDNRMLWKAYQPMIGGFAVSLYMTLYSHISSESVGFTEPSALVQLFLTCGIEPNERGRKRLAEETSKLEAVGLLKTYRNMEDGEVLWYEFHLAPPLYPEAFFGVHHLSLLLVEKLGPGAAELVRRSFVRDGWEPGDPGEDISSPFYEVFRTTVPPPAAEDAWFESAAAAASQPAETFGRDGFRCDELLRRFPRSSANRRFVERFQTDLSRLAELNFCAGRFGLTLKETVSLLDEEGMFTSDGVFDASRFQERAATIYRQANASERGRELLVRKQELSRPSEHVQEEPRASEKREVQASYWLDVPEQFQGKCDAREYNTMLVNAPYTKVLKLFFQPSSVPPGVEEAFLAMNVNYRLPDEVLNVFIHYIRSNDLDWSRRYLDAIAANVAGKRIRTFENAVVYFRKAEQVRSGGGERNGNDSSRKAPERPRGRPQKPVIPVARKGEKKEATEEDIRRIMEKAKRLTDG